MMTEKIYEQAALLAGQLDAQQSALLQLLCQAAESALAARLREGAAPEDCQEAFAAAAALYALGALGEAGGSGGIREFRAGDLTVKRGGTEGSGGSLQQQAMELLRPWLAEGFLFQGV